MHKCKIYFLFLFLIGIEMIGCVPSGSLAKVGEQDYFLEKDEEKIWKLCIEEEQKLDESGFVYGDTIATKYLNDILFSLLPQNIKKSKIRFQVVLLKNPMLNAFAFPNGKMYVHTGILAKAENEAQVAALLGHEVNHVILRHTLKQFRSAKNTSNALAVVGVLAIPFGIYGALVSLLGEVGAVAAITGYSRDAEREADLKGFEYMIAAGYDPREAPKLFEHLKKDIEEQKIDEPFFFGSHPKLKERIESYNELLAKRYRSDSGLVRSYEYRIAMNRLILLNADIDLQAGRYNSSHKCIERILRNDSTNSQAHYLAAEALRQQGLREDQDKAIAEYQSAIQCDSTHACAYRGLGLIALKKKDKSVAQQCFKKYVVLLPQASDRKYIEQYLKQLEE